MRGLGRGRGRDELGGRLGVAPRVKDRDLILHFRQLGHNLGGDGLHILLGLSFVQALREKAGLSG